MFSNTVFSRHKCDLDVATGTWRDMRYQRLWYILPFVVNLLLIFSAGLLVSIIAQNVVEDMSFHLPGWMLFATIAICAPPCLAITRLFPDPSIALAIGGVLTSAGLLWTWFETGPLQMISFCVITGSGISLSAQAIGIALSPIFIRENITASGVTLLLSAFIMFVLCPLTAHANMENNSIFLYFCPVALVISLIPFVVYLHSVKQSCKAKQVKLLYEKNNEVSSTSSENILKIDCENSVSCDNIGHDVQQLATNDGWALSLMSLIVWLTWGAGVDTTWLNLGWRYQYFHTSTGLTTLQLFLCFILLTIKMCTELSQSSGTLCQVNLASNYMQLGLLGTGGLILCLFPENTQAFHNHLLFTAGCALQFDDLSDLCLVRNSSLPTPIYKYKLITYQIGLNEEDEKNQSQLASFCCKICHMLSLLLMSVLAMILGVQIANAVGYLSTLPPLSFICSRVGLLVMSLAAIYISLMRPCMLWKKQKQHIIVL